MAWLITWATGTVLVWAAAATCFGVAIELDEKRKAARLFFLAPAWPVFLIWWIGHLWVVADWGKRQ